MQPRYWGEDTRDCAITVCGVMGGNYKLKKFGSPVQTLIEQSRYVSGDRATDTVLRRVSFARPAGAADKLLISDNELNTRSACLTQAIAAVRVRRH